MTRVVMMNRSGVAAVVAALFVSGQGCDPERGEAFRSAPEDAAVSESPAPGGTAPTSTAPTSTAPTSTAPGGASSVVSRCEEALRSAPTSPCGFEGTCETRQDCCVLTARCDVGRVSFTQDCSECRTCQTDRDCDPLQLCSADGFCRGCPDVSACPRCPEGLAPLPRNGCSTCTCAPLQACAPPEPCRVGTCYPGALCASSACVDFGCCANVCAAVGCRRPAPLGCPTACPADLRCERCITTTCACEGASWRCGAPACVDDVAAFVPAGTCPA